MALDLDMDNKASKISNTDIFNFIKDNLEEAIEYFSKMKQLPKEEFLKLFLVTEIK